MGWLTLMGMPLRILPVMEQMSMLICILQTVLDPRSTTMYPSPPPHHHHRQKHLNLSR